MDLTFTKTSVSHDALSLTAFPTPHDRACETVIAFGAWAVLRSLARRPQGRLTSFHHDFTAFRDALQFAYGQRFRVTLRRTARPWAYPGARRTRSHSHRSLSSGKEMTAAHPSLPMGSKAEVTNLENGKKVEVTINDRGPYAKDRAIDLSSGAAKKLDMKKDGTAQVKIETKPTKKKRSGAGHAKPAPVH